MIVFICNYERTHSVIRLSSRLREYGLQTELWVHDELSKEIAANLKVDFKDLRKGFALRQNDHIGDKICSKIEVFLRNDRFLPFTRSNKEWLIDVYNMTVEFLRSGKSTQKVMFFGEVSWAVEAVISLACEVYQVDYLLPVDTRFLEKRFIMVKSNTELPVELGEIKIKKTPSVFINKPGYTEVELDKIMRRRFTLKKYKKSLQVFKNNKYFKILLSKFLALVIDKVFHYLQTFAKGRLEDFIHEKNMVVFPLHIQPEASVDFLAPELVNQFDLITDLLSGGFRVVVKDHPARINEFYFIEKIKSLFNKNMYISASNENLFKYKNLSIYVTITGTMAGEAGLNGKLGITVKRVFFNVHPNCRFVERQNLVEYIKEVINSFKVEPADLELMNSKFKKDLTDISLPGKCYGFLPDELDEVYLNNYLKLILSYVSNK